METLANLESFVRSAEDGSFSGAARTLGLTAAAVSRNVAMLERNLKARLFHRSTRKLTLTEAGERFLVSIGTSLSSLQAAIADAAAQDAEPSGVLKVSMSPMIGVAQILPLMPAFLAAHPRIRPEWHFENRPVDLIAENYDAAIGGGFDLASGLVARRLAPLHAIAVAAPAYIRGRKLPRDPSALAEHSGIVMRALGTGRIRHVTMRNSKGREVAESLAQSIVMNDPGAIHKATLLGMGVSLMLKGQVVEDLARGDLVRLLPDWYADFGTLSLYYASRTLIAPKTRAFVDHVCKAFKLAQLDVAYDASRRK